MKHGEACLLETLVLLLEDRSDSEREQASLIVFPMAILFLGAMAYLSWDRAALISIVLAACSAGLIVCLVRTVQGIRSPYQWYVRFDNDGIHCWTSKDPNKITTVARAEISVLRIDKSEETVGVETSRSRFLRGLPTGMSFTRDRLDRIELYVESNWPDIRLVIC